MADIPFQPIKRMRLEMVARAPELSEREAIKVWADLGNPILDVNERGIVAVDQIEAVTAAPETDLSPWELMWKCDYCHHFSRDRAVIEKHERTHPSFLEAYERCEADFDDYDPEGI